MSAKDYPTISSSYLVAKISVFAGGKNSFVTTPHSVDEAYILVIKPMNDFINNIDKMMTDEPKNRILTPKARFQSFQSLVFNIEYKNMYFYLETEQ